MLQRSRHTHTELGRLAATIVYTTKQKQKQKQTKRWLHTTSPTCPLLGVALMSQAHTSESSLPLRR